MRSNAGRFCSLIFLVFGTNETAAQSASDVIGVLGGIANFAVTQSVRSEWKKVDANLLSCADKELQENDLSVDKLIQHGTRPSDGRLKNLFDYCRKTLAEDKPAQTVQAQFGQVRPPAGPQPQPAPINRAQQQSAQQGWQSFSRDEQICVVRSLNRQSGLRGIEDLVQAGIGPNDPRIASVAAECKPRIDPLKQFSSAEWRAQSFEKKIIALTATAWSGLKGDIKLCRGKHDERVQCLAKAGHGFTVENPQPCQLRIVETTPINPYLPKTWDGKFVDSQITARGLLLNLKTLRPDMIKPAPASGLDIFFAVDPSDEPLQRIKIDGGDQWITIALPPSRFKPDDYFRVVNSWRESTQKYGNPNITGYELVVGTDARAFIKWSAGNITNDGQNDAVVEAIKQTVANCQ